MRPLMYQQICLARLKKLGGNYWQTTNVSTTSPGETEKLGGNYWRRPNNGNMKYGIRLIRNTKKAAQFDRDNRDPLWENAILKQLEAFILMGVFNKPLPLLHKARAKGYQFVPLRMIFDVKVDLKIKSILVIGGHFVDSSGHKVYASTMKLVSSRILVIIAATNNLEFMPGDIGNA